LLCCIACINVLLAPTHPVHPGCRAVKGVVVVYRLHQELWSSVCHDDESTETSPLTAANPQLTQRRFNTSVVVFSALLNHCFNDRIWFCDRNVKTIFHVHSFEIIQKTKTVEEMVAVRLQMACHVVL